MNNENENISDDNNNIFEKKNSKERLQYLIQINKKENIDFINTLLKLKGIDINNISIKKQTNNNDNNNEINKNINDNKNININNIENNFIDNSQVYIKELLDNLEIKNPNSKISTNELMEIANRRKQN